MNDIVWTKEQEEVIDKMIKESEDIGYVQGRDDSTKEILDELEESFKKIINELKGKLFKK